jgi:DNA-binding MarR family transcriptional regulator
MPSPSKGAKRAIPVALLGQVVAWLDEFAASGGRDAEGFRRWLSESETERNARADASVFEDIPSYGQMPLPGEVGRLVRGVGRRLHQLAKKAMAGDAIESVETFALLAEVLSRPGINKTDLVTHLQLEMSSGSDIIQRLVKQGLLSETVDPADRRARNLSLTLEGFAALQVSFGKMGAVTEGLFSALETSELLDLRALLAKVERIWQG